MKPILGRPLLPLMALTVAVSLMGAFPPAAVADVIPPDVWACNKAKVGDACNGGRGTCQKSTCVRLDYSNWNRGASSSLGSTSHDCLECIAGDGGRDSGAIKDPGAIKDAGHAKDAHAATEAPSLNDRGGMKVFSPLGAWLLSGSCAVLVLILRLLRR